MGASDRLVAVERQLRWPVDLIVVGASISRAATHGASRLHLVCNCVDFSYTVTEDELLKV
jgi:hypothetical protein